MRNIIEKIVIVILIIVNLFFAVAGLFYSFWFFVLFLLEFIGSCIALISIRKNEESENWDNLQEENKQKSYRQEKLKLDQERATLNRERASLNEERNSFKLYKEKAEDAKTEINDKISENRKTVEKQRKDIENNKRELEKLNSEIKSKNEELELKKKQMKSFADSMENMKENSNNSRQHPNNKVNKNEIIKININKAGVDEIKTLPNISQLQAEKIVQMRENGSYIKSFDDLADKLNLSSYQITVLEDYIIIDNPVPKVNGRFIDI